MFSLLLACASIPVALAAPAKTSNITSTQDSFDYVIVGGGLAGLTLPMVAGKTLGGSGSINGASWTKEPKTRYDLLPLLTGDMSWGWDGLNQYMLGAEHFHTPSNYLKSKGANHDGDKHGYSGPVQVSFAQGMFGSIQQPALNASQQIWGLGHVDDAVSGIVNGVTTISNMIRWSNTCTDAEPECVLSADGIHYQAFRNSERLFVKATREVLLATGSMQSPQLLELSGVGDPAILNKANVPVQKSLKGVGKNLQEQTKNTITYIPKSEDLEGSGPSSAIAIPNTLASLASYAADLEAQGLIVNATATHEILKYQVANLFNQSEAAAEIFFTLASKTDSAPATVGADLWNLPSYFNHPLDLRLQTLATKQAAQVYSTAPLADMVERRVFPASELESYEAWEAFVKDTFISAWHPITTLSMMKAEMGGVVDNRLKVYGLANVRAVDASVLPVQLSAHLSSSLYGVAEKAAVMIEEDQN
ncbi:unnamed protein product [Aureobasidium vineae]|uniref:Glucose-methanol-choline oxidoreductase N-terminal domain-containing protein n=1 Tax=Aureobasidium vineae TaxID=2773715 RepID=A0A9N8K0K9_9PEZI|nr:unnamed protein product [Aureobasidium vineae]